MSETNEQPDPHDEARDRLTDRVLAEALGAENPPDLSEAIASRVADFQAVPQAAEEKTMQSRRAWMVLLTTAASLMLAAFLLRGETVLDEGSVAMEVEQPAEIALRSASASNTGRQEAVNPEFATAGDEIMVTELSEAVASPIVGDLATINADLEQPFRQGSFPMAPAESSDLGRSEELSLDIDTSSRPALVEAIGGRMPEQKENRWRMQVADGKVPTNMAQSYGAASTPLPATPSSAPFGVTNGIQGGQPDAGFTWGKRQQLDAAGSIRGSSLSEQREFYAGTEIRLQEEKADYRKRQTFGFHQNRYHRWPEHASGDRYTPIHENDFITPRGGDALSTFSIDVDTASYSNVRRFLMESRRLPDPNAVRIEELVNYFEYDYAAPESESEAPFAASMEVGYCPWKSEHRLVRIGLQGREIDADKRPLSNLVFLVDVSGSMQDANKLPLVIEGLKALTDRLGENDRVAIVVYAGSEGVVLPSTSGVKKDEIRSALGRLTAGGSTAGGAGLKLAYEIAERNQIVGGVNRVVLCTDGDFNVGLTGTEELAKLVGTRAKETGVFLTVLGFGSGNLNDAMLEEISGRGDGHYAYIDSESEARRVLSRDLSGTLVTIAKDVKIQVEFNPAKVASYRLIGYENRVMAAKDFNDDTKDAGEIGAGHTVTALYEVVPVGVETPAPAVDGLKYQQADDSEPTTASDQEPTADSPQPIANSNEMLTLKVRYKQPEGGASTKLEFPLEDPGADARLQETIDFRWAASVAEFGMLLRNSRHRGEATYEHVLESARAAIGEDPHGYRSQMLDLVRRAQELSKDAGR